MGIHSFFSWFKKHFNEDIYHLNKGETFEILKEESVLEEEIVIDNLMIDMNGIFHNSAQKVYEYGNCKPPRRLLGVRRPKQQGVLQQKELFKDVCDTIESTFNIVKPKKRVILCVDGTAPLSKQCICEGTLITRSNGTSIPIEKITKDEYVLGWNGKGYTSTKNKGLQEKGIKDVVKITLYDYTHLICTTDHKILVKNNSGIEWIEANNIKSNDCIISGIEMPEDILDTLKEEKWSLDIGYIFNMTSYNERVKSLILARILGYLLSDGYVSQKCSGVYFGTIIDAKLFVEDLFIITGKRPKIGTKIGDKGTVFELKLPKTLLIMLLNIHNLPIGKRICQKLTIPSFLLHEDCPNSIRREFLGGLFGGDGHAPYLYKCRNGNYTLTPVKFSQSTIIKYENEFKLYLNNICYLLKQFGVNSNIQGPIPHTYKDDKMIPKDVLENPRVKYTIVTEMNSIFATKIGMRYATNKILRVTVASSYWKQCENIKNIRNKIVKRAIEIYENYKPSYKCPNCYKKLSTRNSMTRHMKYRCTIKKSIDFPITHCNIKIALKQSRQECNDIIICDKSLSSMQEINYIKNRGYPSSTRRIRYSIDAYEFLSNTGTLEWFLSDENITYAMQQTSDFIPYWYRKVINICSFGKKKVYDIEVEDNHSFLANGLCVHNCQQRARRFVSALERDEKAWDSNQITPGTQFMDYLSKYIDWWIRKKISEDDKWKNIEVVFSNEKSNGEGEHKLISYIRKYGSRTESYCINGMDADLIMLSLGTHITNFYILREEPMNPNFDFYVIDIKGVRNTLGEFLRWNDTKYIYDIESGINDFIFMCFTVGNDFLPHIPAIEIVEGGIDFMIDVYKNVCNAYGHLTRKRTNGDIRFCKKSLMIFLGTISQYEKRVLENKLKHRGDYFPDLLLESNSEYKTDGTYEINIEEYKEAYYSKNLLEDKNNIEKICHEYLEGMQWVLSYYTKGVPNWKWRYPYYYAPFASTLTKYVKSFEFPVYGITSPTLPFVQLLSVLPPKSANLLPNPLDTLLRNKSNLSKYCPEDFIIDLSGKRQEWQGVVILPMVDYSIVEKEYLNLIEKVDPKERKRNILGKSFVYNYSENTNIFNSYYGNLNCKCTIRMIDL
jgi:intein/homing endonuclease